MSDGEPTFGAPEEILAHIEGDTSALGLNLSRGRLFQKAAAMFALRGDSDKTRRCCAESVLFYAHAQEPAADDPRARYLGPLAVMEGRAFADPDIIPEAMLDYFEERVKQTNNPYLKARYADLLWQRGRGHIYAREGIASHLEIVGREAAQEQYHTAVESARRALSLAFALRDGGTREAVIEKMTNAAEEWAKAGEKGRLFTPEIIDKILSRPRFRNESILNRWISLLKNALQTETGHRIRRDLLSQLTKVLDRRGRHEEARQYQIKIGEEWEAEAQERESDSLVAAVFYNSALEAYAEAGASKKVEELKIKTRAKYKSAEKDLKPLSWQFKIDVGPWTDQVSEWLNEGCYEALVRLAGYLALIPRWRAAEEQSARLNQEAPLSHLIPRTILDDGRPISHGQTEEERHLQNVRHQYNMMMIGTAAQLSSAIGLIRERQLLTADCLVEAIKDSPFFDTDKIELIRRGFERYVEGDYISTVHVLVPQAEDVLRRFLGKLGGNTLSYREGRLREKPLDQVLSADEMKATLKLLSGEVWEYFNHILIAETGMNLRNKIAHGLITVGDIDENTANIVVHLYLLLGLFCSKNDGSE